MLLLLLLSGYIVGAIVCALAYRTFYKAENPRFSNELPEFITLWWPVLLLGAIVYFPAYGVVRLLRSIAGEK